MTNPNTVLKKEQFKVLITATRERLKMTQDQFANYLGVPLITAQHWERGVRKPSSCAIRLLEVLGTVESMSPDLHAMMIPDPEPVKPRKRSGRPPKAPFDPANDSQNVPTWLFVSPGGASPVADQ